MTTIRATQRTADGTEVQTGVGMNNEKAIFSTQTGAPYEERSRLRDMWTIMTATPFTPLVVIPTVNSKLELYNPASSVKTAVVVDLTAFQLLSTAASQTYAIWSQVAVAKQAAPTNTALNMYSLSGKAPVASGSDLISAINTTVVENGWRPWGPPQAWGTATATPGNAWNAPVDGKLLIPPGCALCLTIVGALATASTFHVGATFYWSTMVPRS